MSDIRLQIKEKINIINFLEEEGVKLEYNGRQYKGLCPFHTEKTPSFLVSEEFQNYKCFGCGESGDIFSYVIKKYGLNFSQSLAFLADKAQIPYNISEQSFVDLSRLYELTATVEEIYKKSFKDLPEFHIAKEDIIKRGLDINTDIYGYSPNSKGVLRKILLERGFSEEELKNSGIFAEKDPAWDLFSGRLVFFIKNYMGKTIGFSGRGYSDKGPKYINSKDSTIYNKNKALYNIENAKKHIRDLKKVYVVEGLFDVIAMSKKGYKNVVATCGTAVTQDHIRQLIQYSNNGEIVLLLDGDNAGKKAARRAFINYKEIQDNGKIIILPDDQDPCDYLMENDKLPLEQHLVDYFIELSKKIIFEEDTTTINKIRKIDMLFLESIVSDILYNEIVKKLSVLLEIIEWPSKRVSKESLVKFEEEEKRAPWNLLALSFWIRNRKVLGSEILKEGDFKEPLWDLIRILKTYADKDKIIPEDFGKYESAVKGIIETETSFINEAKIAKSHYKMLVRQYKKTLEKEKNMLLRKQLHERLGGE